MPAAKSSKSVYIVYVLPALVRLPGMLQLLREMGGLRGAVPKKAEEQQLIQALERLGCVVTFPKQVDVSPPFGPNLVFGNEDGNMTLQVPWHYVLCILTTSEESARQMVGFVT